MFATDFFVWGFLVIITAGFCKQEKENWQAVWLPKRLSLHTHSLQLVTPVCLQFQGDTCNRLFGKGGLWHGHSPPSLCRTRAMAFEEDVLGANWLAWLASTHRGLLAIFKEPECRFPWQKCSKGVHTSFFKILPARWFRVPSGHKGFLALNELRRKALLRAPQGRMSKSQPQRRNTGPGWL